MKIIIGADHRGVTLKSKIKKLLKKLKIEVEDVGTNTRESCDYPDFGFKVAEEVSKNNYDYGILICNSGIGMSIVANKVKGIRASLCLNEIAATYARKDNNANVLVLSAEFTPDEKIEDIINNFLNTKFEGDRHERRINKIKEYEAKFVEKEKYEKEIKKWQKEARMWQSRAWRR